MIFFHAQTKKRSAPFCLSFFQTRGNLSVSLYLETLKVTKIISGVDFTFLFKDCPIWTICKYMDLQASKFKDLPLNLKNYPDPVVMTIVLHKHIIACGKRVAFTYICCRKTPRQWVTVAFSFECLIFLEKRRHSNDIATVRVLFCNKI